MNILEQDIDYTPSDFIGKFLKTVKTFTNFPFASLKYYTKERKVFVVLLLVRPFSKDNTTFFATENL